MSMLSRLRNRLESSAIALAALYAGIFFALTVPTGFPDVFARSDVAVGPGGSLKVRSRSLLVSDIAPAQLNVPPLVEGLFAVELSVTTPTQPATRGAIIVAYLNLDNYNWTLEQHGNSLVASASAAAGS